MVDRGVIERALSSPEWRSAADALFQASGISVSVVDFSAGDVIYGQQRCSFCHLASDSGGADVAVCFDVVTAPTSGISRVNCRGGSIAHIAPILVDGVPVAHVVAAGFVASTRERRRLFEYLLNRGVSQESARLAVKTVPVVTRREAESYVQIAVAVAEAAVVAVNERDVAQARERDARIIERISSKLAFMDVTDGTILAGILGEALHKAGSSAGALLVPAGDELEIVAVGGEWRGAPGTRVPYAATAVGRAATTRRPVIVPGEREGAQTTYAAPIMVGNKVLGVLEMRLPGNVKGLVGERQRRVDSLMRLLSTILERRRAKEEADRLVTSYLDLDEYASSVARIGDYDRVETHALGVLARTFDAECAGISVSAWGRDRARLTLSGRLASTELDLALEHALGRNLARDPLCERVVEGAGEIVESDHEPSDLPVLAAPMQAGDLVVGYCILVGAPEQRFDAHDFTLLERVARHTAAALERAALFGRLRDDYAQTIAALSAMLDATEHPQGGQTHRVMEYALLIGDELQLPVDEFEQLRFAGLLHDVGKDGLSREILLKPAKLTADELAHLQSQEGTGTGVLEQIDFLKSITPVILHHHERWDGEGYPMRLRGTDIPLLARILAVADGFEALTSERSFRSALPLVQARKEMEREAGRLYDPAVVTALLAALDRQALVGATGLLAPREAKGRRDLPA